MGWKGRAGDAGAVAELARVKDEERRFAADKDRRLRQVKLEPPLVGGRRLEMVAHALVLPAGDAGERDHHGARLEEVAMRVAQAHEETSGATVHDVWRPERARHAGLGGWPGFDLLSVAPTGDRRAIEVKGRAGAGDVVYDCATPRAATGARPRPVREAAREEPGILRSCHPGVRGAGGGGDERPQA